jgi:hypothetical protein
VPAFIPRNIILDTDIHELFYDESNNINYADSLCEFMFRNTNDVESLYDSKDYSSQTVRVTIQKAQ